MSDQQQRFEIRFDGLSVADAGTNAKKLREDLLGISPDAAVNVVKDDPTNLDMGATLILVLGTPAVIAIANGIASYLKRARGTISISSNGKVVATGLTGNDAARIAEAFAPPKKATK